MLGTTVERACGNISGIIVNCSTVCNVTATCLTLITEENGEQDYENMCIHNVGANFCTDNSLSFPREEILEEAISSITKDVSNYQEELKINSTIEKVKKDIKNLQISRKIGKENPYTSH